MTLLKCCAESKKKCLTALKVVQMSANQKDGRMIRGLAFKFVCQVYWFPSNLRWKMESTVNLDTENCKIESDSPGEYFINDDNVD